VTDRIDNLLALNAPGATGGQVFVFAGSGSPDTVVPAPIGSLYLRTDGSTSTTLYVKTGGTSTSATPWTAK
jgi:hypothetical protein